MSAAGEAATAGPPAPFVVGMTRSGTTLLRLMLDSHPQLAIPPETHFLPEVIAAFREGQSTPEEIAGVMAANRRWPDFEIEPAVMLEHLRGAAPFESAGDALRAFYGYYADREGKPRWGDKTPGYATKMRRIWRALPEARFVHMIRDGRDVALSLARRQSGLSTKEVANRWSHRIRKTRKLATVLPHYMEIRYEDLVTNPEEVVRRVCGFIELDYDPVMLAYHERSQERLRELERPLRAEEGKRGLTAESRLQSHALTAEPPRPDRAGAWREELPPEEVEIFEKRAGKLLSELGYDRAPSSP